MTLQSFATLRQLTPFESTAAIAPRAYWRSTRPPQDSLSLCGSTSPRGLPSWRVPPRQRSSRMEQPCTLHSSSADAVPAMRIDSSTARASHAWISCALHPIDTQHVAEVIPGHHRTARDHVARVERPETSPIRAIHVFEPTALQLVTRWLFGQAARQMSDREEVVPGSAVVYSSNPGQSR